MQYPQRKNYVKAVAEQSSMLANNTQKQSSYKFSNFTFFSTNI